VQNCEVCITFVMSVWLTVQLIQIFVFLGLVSLGFALYSNIGMQVVWGSVS